MLRSLYSGVTGMKNHQTKLDVIGNNISNVNTYGFKKGRVTFKNEISQMIAGAAAPSGNLGGTNAKQVGLGSSLGSIDTIHDSGSLQTTNRLLDLAIGGEGYFIVNNGQQDLYTRAGNFYLDKDGSLVTSEGNKVQGIQLYNNTGNPTTALNANGKVQQGALVDIQIPFGNPQADGIPVGVTLESFSISPTGEINEIYSNGQIRQVAKVVTATFTNTSGLTSVGGSNFQASNNSGIPELDYAGDGRGTISSGKLEMSNVDLGEEFTEMITAQRGFQANTRIITTSDEILQELVNLKR